MVNALGKVLRKWRIDKEVSMREMANSISISTAFLSSVELGKKQANDDLIKKISTYFNLNEELRIKLNDAVFKSNGEVKLSLNVHNLKDQSGILAFARKYSSLSDETKEKIGKLLND